MNEKTTGRDENRDPITGEPGSHPVGTGVGAAGAGLAGAAAGMAVGGPVGGVIGAVSERWPAARAGTAWLSPSTPQRKTPTGGRTTKMPPTRMAMAPIKTTPPPIAPATPGSGVIPAREKPSTQRRPICAAITKVNPRLWIGTMRVRPPGRRGPAWRIVAAKANVSPPKLNGSPRKLGTVFFVGPSDRRIAVSEEIGVPTPALS